MRNLNLATPAEKQVAPAEKQVAPAPSQQSASRMHGKYAEAVRMYAETELPLKEIATRCGFTSGALGCYLRRYHRHLVLRRHAIALPEGKAAADVKIIRIDQLAPATQSKYAAAVAACDSMEYISENLSQVARRFNLDGTSLANFMRVHYAAILEWRERTRQKLGIADNMKRGARPSSARHYARAVELYSTTHQTITEVAAACGVSASGFSQHLRFYHRDLLARKRADRKQAVAEPNRKRGRLTGNGRIYRPLPATDARYAEALALYRDTALTMKEIVARTGVPTEGFRAYLHKWHRPLVFERSGLNYTENETVDLRRARRRMKSVAVKYEAAIESLRRQPRPMARVAAEFGLHPEVFREYLHRHEPDLAQGQGMAAASDGSRRSNRSQAKYAEALRLFTTTPESLKSICDRLGLVYSSVGNYVRRSRPEAKEAHCAVVQAQRAADGSR